MDDFNSFPLVIKTIISNHCLSLKERLDQKIFIIKIDEKFRNQLWSFLFNDGPIQSNKEYLFFKLFLFRSFIQINYYVSFKLESFVN